MNTLKIKLNPYKDINIASLDDKPLSPYSELNNYMKEPFLSWASKLLDAAEREINDDYTLIVTSELFERLFLEGMQNDFDSCKEYLTDSFQVDTSTSERFELIKKLALKYGISYSLDDFKMPIYTDVQLSLDASFVNATSVDNAKLIISNDKAIVDHARRNPYSVIVILITGRNTVTSIGDEKYVWEISEEELDKVLNSVLDRFVKTPAIVKVANLLNNVSDTMDDEDRRMLSLATEIDPFLSIADVPEIEVGNTSALGVVAYPEGSEIPNLRLVPQNGSLVEINGLEITAIASGTTFVDIYKAEENIPFARKTITTYQNNFVKRIDLNISSTKMGINRKQLIDITFTPSDAEDVQLVKWSVDNTDVASVSEEGEIVALKEGTATITASTKMATSSIVVTVLSNIKNIVSTVSHSDLYVGQTQPIAVSIDPVNCFDPSYEWKSSDKAVAIVEKQDDGNTVIRATGIGSCVLTCVAKEGGCSTTCNVNVESTFKKRENAHGMLSLTAVLAVACIFCAALELSFVVVPVAVATCVCGVLAVGKNKADRFWAFILMAAAVLIALETMGITNFM